MKREISSENAPKAIGPYSQAISTPMYVFVSGQLPVCLETGELASGIEAQTEACFENIAAVLAERNMSVNDIVKTTVFMTDLTEFAKMNEVYAKFFKAPYPARSTVGVSSLPKGASIEIECIAVKSY